MDYPVFRDPKGYLARREGRFAPKTLLKKWYERRAIDRCLSHTSRVASVCDVPCGPGRLFEVWRDRGWRVTGMDLSEEMVEASRVRHQQLELGGEIIHHNAFEPSETVVDLVASIRFVYYFEKEKRIELIRSLAEISNRYLLLQYKTVETRKGRKNANKPLNKNRAYAKYHCTNREIAEEIAEAGLTLLTIELISQSSDRVFVLAETGVT